MFIDRPGQGGPFLDTKTAADPWAKIGQLRKPVWFWYPKLVRPDHFTKTNFFYDRSTWQWGKTGIINTISLLSVHLCMHYTVSNM